MSRVRRIVLVLATSSLIVGGVGTSAHAAPTWAPAATATIHPGVNIFTNGAECTANFVFFDATNVYIGQAGHCSGTGGNTETNGCTAGVLPEGTKVDIDGASQKGTIVYNSWVEMQANGEDSDDACLGNDFALVKIDPADAGKVNPSVPFWGGPSGLSSGPSGVGELAYSYQNSILRFGLSPLSSKVAVEVFNFNEWTHLMYTVTPGIPGDSGSGYMDANGRAFGVLSTIVYAPYVASNEVANLSSALAYMKAHDSSLSGVTLANGTEPFSPLL